MSSHQSLSGVGIFSQTFKQVKPKLFYFLFAFFTAAGFLSIRLKALSFLESNFLTNLIVPFSDLTQLIWTFFAFSILIGIFNFSKNWEQNRKTDVKNLFSVIFNTENLIRMAPYLFFVSLILFINFQIKRYLPVFKEPNPISIGLIVLELCFSAYLYFVGIKIFDSNVGLGVAFKDVVLKTKDNFLTIFSLLIILGAIISIYLIFPIYFEKVTFNRDVIQTIGIPTVRYGSKLIGILLLVQLFWLVPVVFHLPYTIYNNIFQKQKS